MKKFLWSFLSFATLFVMSAGAAQAEPLAFIRAFRPLGQGSSFDSIAFDHLNGDILVKASGPNGSVTTPGNEIKIYRYDHFGGLKSVSTLNAAALGFNGEEFDLDVYAAPSANLSANGTSNGGTTAFNGSTIVDGTILLFNGSNSPDTVTALTNTTTLTNASIISTLTTGGSGGKIAGAVNSTSGLMYTLNRVATDKVVSYNMNTGAVAAGANFSTQSPLVGSGATDPSDINPDYSFNVLIEGDIAVHQNTGNLYVVSGQTNHHVIRVFSSTGTFIKDINLDAILQAAGQPTTILDSITGIAVEPQDWGHYPYQNTPWTTDENIWLATKNGWIIHITTDNNYPGEIPEPGSLALLGIGSVVLLVYRRRQKLANV
ncbi:MAG: PEP-CTERM sorting domain-containing protein [Planctomycetota bacterium]|nr:PEP-CTERM sorting domain-containing protein [Planctomycetota bacterium]MDA1211714.1 PEP-CTERM sorting domain-containing protein [Planctomycetota bacterium]